MPITPSASIATGDWVYILAEADSSFEVEDLFMESVMEIDPVLIGRFGEVMEIGNDDGIALVRIDDATHRLPATRLERCPTIGWEFCKRHLPMEDQLLIEGFLHREKIKLRPDIKHRILRSLPDLDQRIRRRMHAHCRASPHTATPKHHPEQPS